MSNGFDRDPSNLEAARLSLVRIAPSDEPDAKRALHRALTVSAGVLATKRVSIWLFEDESTLRSIVALDADAPDSRAGGMLEAGATPRYLAALRSRRALASDDVESDPRVAELLPYLRAYGIRALLDIPLFLDGEVVGLVCHEHVGEPRAWSKRDIDFGVSVADVVSTLLGNYRRIALEEELKTHRAAAASAARMEAQAALARHVAHDVNNLLTIIAAASSKVSPPEFADLIEEQCKRGGELVRRLVEFSGPALPRTPRGTFDLRAAVTGAEALMRAAAGGNCALVIAPLPLVPVWVRGTVAEIEQVLLNLVLNARDAARPAGGTIDVTLELLASPSGDEARLSVRDDGSGIAPQHLPRIFDPYFTTKQARGGAGLGLASTHGIVHRLEGTISVRSAPGETVFAITLPLAAGPGSAAMS